MSVSLKKATFHHQDVVDVNYIHDDLIPQAAVSSGEDLQRIHNGRAEEQSWPLHEEGEMKNLRAEEERLHQRMAQEVAEFQRDTCIKLASPQKELENITKHKTGKVSGARASSAKFKGFQGIFVVDDNDISPNNLIQQAVDASSAELQGIQNGRAEEQNLHEGGRTKTCRAEEETLRRRMAQEVAEFHRDTCIKRESLCKELENVPKYMTGKVSGAPASAAKFNGAIVYR